MAVQADASMTTEVDTGAPATAEEIHPPGFVSAAKREHRNEAAALRQHRLDVVKVCAPAQRSESRQLSVGSSSPLHCCNAQGCNSARLAWAITSKLERCLGKRYMQHAGRGGGG